VGYPTPLRAHEKRETVRAIGVRLSPIHPATRASPPSGETYSSRFHTDHLGSITTITEECGEVVEQLGEACPRVGEAEPGGQRGQAAARERDGPVTVVKVVDTGRTAQTYNLEVADFHTYFVGESRAWVHNVCWSEGRQILEGMAKVDKHRGVTRADVEAYKDLNRTLPDPIPIEKIRVDPGHPSSPHPVIRAPHAHIGGTDHIPILDP
jgi:hypothetical protein